MEPFLLEKQSSLNDISKTFEVLKGLTGPNVSNVCPLHRAANEGKPQQNCEGTRRTGGEGQILL